MAPGLTQPIRIERTASLHGGMNDRDKPWVLQEFQAVLLQNLDPFKLGAREKRLGVSSIGGRPEPAFGMGTMFDVTLGDEVVLARHGTEAWINNGSGNMIKVATNVSLLPHNYQFTEGRWNSTNAVFLNTLQRDATDISLAGPLTAIDINRNVSQNASMAPTACTWFQNRLWAIDNKYAPTADAETLWWSQLVDGLSFSDGNTIQVEPGIGGRLTGLLPVRSGAPTLIIWKEELITLLLPRWGSSGFIPAPADALDSVNSQLRIVTKKAGCVATDSIQYVPGAPDGDIYFLSQDGIRAVARATDDTIQAPSLPVSLPIQDTIDRINFKFAQVCRSVVFDNRYYLSVPLDGAETPSHLLVRDLPTGAWFLYTWAPAGMVSSRLTQTEERLWWQNANLATDTVIGSLSVEGYHIYNGLTGRLDPSNAPIQYREDSRAYTFGDPTVRKQWEWLGISAVNQGDTAVIDVYYSVDNAAWTLAPQSPLFFPPGAANLITLAQDPLPWNPEDLTVNTRKINFSGGDLPIGFMLQISLRGQSDFATPQLVQTMIGARIWDQEFDNRIT